MPPFRPRLPSSFADPLEYLDYLFRETAILTTVFDRPESTRAVIETWERVRADWPAPSMDLQPTPLAFATVPHKAGRA